MVVPWAICVITEGYAKKICGLYSGALRKCVNDLSRFPGWGVFGPHGRVYLKCFERVEYFAGYYIGHIQCYYRNKPERMRVIIYGRA